MQTARYTYYIMNCQKQTYARWNPSPKAGGFTNWSL